MIHETLCAFVALFLVGGLVACSSQMQRSAALSPQYLRANPAQKDGRTGLPYFLPDTVVPITVAGDFVVLPERKSDEKDWKPKPVDFEYVLTVTVGAPKQVADPNAALMLEYVPEAASDDVFKLGVGANGLLNTVKSTSTDQSSAIILKLAELVKEAAKLAVTTFDNKTVLAQPDEGDTRRAACYRQLQKMSVTMELNMSDVLKLETAPLLVAGDPAGAVAALMSGQTQQLNRSVMLAMLKTPNSVPDGGPVRKISLNGKAPSPVAGSVLPDVPGGVENGNKTYSGVVFRMMVPRRFSIDIDTNGLNFGDGCSLRSVAAYSDGSTTMVAHPNQTFVVDNSRGVFVKKRVDLLVADGVLNGIEVDKPSELLAIVSLPVDVLKTIASIPGEILSVKVKQLSDEKGLTNAQVELLKAQIELIKQKQALTDAQNPPAK